MLAISNPELSCSAFAADELKGTVVDRFERVVERNPVHVAISYKGETTSYGMLEARSNQLAHQLLALMGSGPEPVGLMSKHGVAHHECQLAVLKSGKFYCNLDAELLPERLELILQNLGARYLLHDQACEKKSRELASHFPELSCVNIETLVLHGFPPVRLPVSIASRDNAFIVYTSGSTGPPQGVLLTHGNVLHLARSHGEDIGLNNTDRATQVCPLWTAASGSEIYCSLLNEVTLYPCSLQTDGILYFSRLLGSAGITTMVASPVLFRTLMQTARAGQKFSTMRVIRLGGDSVTQRDVQLLQQYFTEQCRLRIGYGSSEFIPVSRFYIDHHYQVDARIPVGMPMQGCEISIIDEQGNEVRRGEIGEIAVRSAWLSPGYWNNAVLTSERFPTDAANAEGRRYLTRDLGYKDASGQLYHMGRKDSRIKIYGKMVLLTDIEQAARAIGGVRESVAIPFNQTGEKGTELALFVVGDVAENVIRNQLLNALPPEIIPRKFVFLTELPLLPNNKTNRMKLREIAEQAGYSTKLSPGS